MNQDRARYFLTENGLSTDEDIIRALAHEFRAVQELAFGRACLVVECQDYRWRNRREHGYIDVKPCGVCGGCKGKRAICALESE